MTDILLPGKATLVEAVFKRIEFCLELVADKSRAEIGYLATQVVVCDSFDRGCEVALLGPRYYNGGVKPICIFP